MHSLRTKTTVLMIIAIIVAMITATVIAVLSIQRVGSKDSEELLLLLCETGEKNLDLTFESVEQSVGIISEYIQKDLHETSPDKLDEHVERTRELFYNTASRTTGAMTFYYRIDPAYSQTVKGYWYVDMEGTGFIPHTVTDISDYDTTDTSALVWFTVPKATGQSLWLPSYITENLGVRVISYNVPIYRDEDFVGVVGIEIGYSVLAAQVESIKLYDHGYAFINDSDGNLVYHPHTNVLQFDENNKLIIPDGIRGEEKFIKYDYNGVKKLSTWADLRNGMRLNVCVPLSEINGNWQRMTYYIIIAAAIILAIFITLSVVFTRRFTKPLQELTEAAEEINKDNYDVKIDYSGDDEIGLLSKTFNKLINHLRSYISDLNSLAYGDALTSVRNKGAFDIYLREMQTRLNDHPDERPEFAIGIFDCDNLKQVNDRYGHEKGDIYLKNASHLICRVFKHSPVFRIGGDEFAVAIQNEDYERRHELVREFMEKSSEICAFANHEWEKVHVSLGLADFDPKKGRNVETVVRRADRLMYENKRSRKGE